MSDDLYQQAIIALAKRSREQVRLDEPDLTVTVDNPLCGDRVTIDLTICGDRIDKVGHRTRGCLLCEAAAGLITDHAPGETVERTETRARTLVDRFSDDAEPLDELWPGLDTLAPARRYKSRHDCVKLPFQALIKAFGGR